MQLALTQSAGNIAARTGLEPAGSAAISKRPRAAAQPIAPPVVPTTPALMRGGLRGVDTSVNRQVAGAQRAIEYLHQLSAHLQGLKHSLSGQLARGGESQSIEHHARSVEQLWRERARSSLGTIDAQLEFHASGQSRQTFTVRGLQMSSLQTGDRETLSVAIGGHVQRAQNVMIEPSLSSAELLQRFDRALAPSGIRAHLDARGELTFSAPETAWPQVRDSFAIKGEGRRFPTGQFSHVRLTPEEPALRPHEWHPQDVAGLRDALKQVVAAQDKVREAQSAAENTLTDIGASFGQRADNSETALKVDATWSTEFARAFADKAGSADYHAISAVAPALHGLSRDRVLALLAPKQA